VNSFKIRFIFLLVGLSTCQLEKNCGSLPILDYPEAKKIFAGRHEIYKGKTITTPTIYCGKINLSLYSDFSFTLMYRPDSCDCFHGFRKLTGDWDVEWWNITLYPEATEDSYLPWLMQIPLCNSESRLDSIDYNYYFIY